MACDKAEAVVAWQVRSQTRPLPQGKGSEVRCLSNHYCVFTLMFLGGSIAAADSSASPAASPAAASQDHQAAAGADHASPGTAAIPPGTVITMSNWRQFQDYMPDGMIRSLRQIFLKIQMMSVNSLTPKIRKNLHPHPIFSYPPLP